jgi:hypothetical protein
MVTTDAGQTGSATSTVTVSDGINSASDMFTLVVNASAPSPAAPGPPNQAPTLSGVADRTIEESGSVTLTFTIGDDATAATQLSVSAESLNTALLPPSGVVLGGSGETRTLTFSGPGTVTFPDDLSAPRIDG